MMTIEEHAHVRALLQQNDLMRALDAISVDYLQRVREVAKSHRQLASLASGDDLSTLLVIVCLGWTLGATVSRARRPVSYYFELLATVAGWARSHTTHVDQVEAQTRTS
jgi:hypothetical protein